MICNITVNTTRVLSMSKAEARKLGMERTRGTGAGGTNTTKNGTKFEKLLDNKSRFLQTGFEKVSFVDKPSAYYLKRKTTDRTEFYVRQNAFNILMHEQLNIPTKNLAMRPDEAFVIIFDAPVKKPIVRILEIKSQKVAGSVDEKLLAGYSRRELYRLSLGNFIEVEFAFSVSKFLQDSLQRRIGKNKFILDLLISQQITVFFAEEPDYTTHLDAWTRL